MRRARREDRSDPNPIRPTNARTDAGAVASPAPASTCRGSADRRRRLARAIRLPVRYTFRVHSAQDDDRDAGHRPRRPDRRHRGRDRPPRAGPRSVDPRAVRDGPLSPRTRRVGGVGRQADATAARPARLRQHHRRLPAGAAGRRRGRAGPQLLARPRRHRGRRRRATPPPDAVDDPRRPAGDQHRRHDVQPVAHRPPSADRPRLPRQHGPAPDAPLRRDLPGAVRGPVHRHRDERRRTSSSASISTST